MIWNRLSRWVVTISLLSFILYSTQAKAHSNLVTRLFERGSTLFNGGKADAAVPYLKDATDQDAAYPEAWLLLGRCYLHLGDGKAAVSALRQAAQLNSNQPDAHEYLGDAYVIEGDSKDAIGEYTQATKLNSTLSDAYFELGLAHLAVGDLVASSSDLLHLDVIDAKRQKFRRLQWILTFVQQGLKPFHPSYEANKDPKFKVFKDRLMIAVRSRDVSYTLAAIDPQIAVDLTGNVGRGNFRRSWRVDNPNSPFWTMLLNALEVGGEWEVQAQPPVDSVDKGSKIFEAPAYDTLPYVRTATTDEVTDGLYRYSVVVQDQVALRQRPSESSLSTATLNAWDVVIADWSSSITTIYDIEFSRPKWMRVITAKGQVGFIDGDKLCDVRFDQVTFARLSGKWHIVAFGPAFDL